MALQARTLSRMRQAAVGTAVVAAAGIGAAALGPSPAGASPATPTVTLTEAPAPLPEEPVAVDPAPALPPLDADDCPACGLG